MTVKTCPTLSWNTTLAVFLDMLSVANIFEVLLEYGVSVSSNLKFVYLGDLAQAAVHLVFRSSFRAYHAASARRTVRHPRVAPFLLRLRSSFPYSATLPRPAPPLRRAASSAPHHLII